MFGHVSDPSHATAQDMHPVRLYCQIIAFVTLPRRILNYLLIRKPPKYQGEKIVEFSIFHTDRVKLMNITQSQGW